MYYAAKQRQFGDFSIVGNRRVDDSRERVCGIPETKKRPRPKDCRGTRINAGQLGKTNMKLSCAEGRERYLKRATLWPKPQDSRGHTSPQENELRPFLPPLGDVPAD